MMEARCPSRLETNKGKLEYKTYSRVGTDSPTLLMLYYNNKWITPYEQVRLDIHLHYTAVLHLLYEDHLETLTDLIYKQNPLLDMISKEENFGIHQVSYLQLKD